MNTKLKEFIDNGEINYILRGTVIDLDREISAYESFLQGLSWLQQITMIIMENFVQDPENEAQDIIENPNHVESDSTRLQNSTLSSPMGQSNFK